MWCRCEVSGKSLDNKCFAWEWYERVLEVPLPFSPQLRMGVETGRQIKQ